MSELDPLQKEEIARRWCSKKHNIELKKTDIVFWDRDGMMHRFEFDIASHPQQKEIEELQNELKKYEEEHGKIKDLLNNEYFIKIINLRALSPDDPDNRKIVGMVKSGKYDNSGNTFGSILGDCFLLTKAKADKKYMILTDQKMHDYVRKRCEVLLDEIELVYLDADENKDLLNDV